MLLLTRVSMKYTMPQTTTATRKKLQWAKVRPLGIIKRQVIVRSEKKNVFRRRKSDILWWNWKNSRKWQGPGFYWFLVLPGFQSGLVENAGIKMADGWLFQYLILRGRVWWLTLFWTMFKIRLRSPKNLLILSIILVFIGLIWMANQCGKGNLVFTLFS